MTTESSLYSSKSRAGTSVLLPAEKVQERVKELAAEIDRYYQGREVLLLVVLKGAFVFAADLMRCLETPVQVGFIRLQSYGDATSSDRQVRVVSDVAEKIEERDVLVVEDIIDSGWSLDFLLEHLRDRGATEVKVCALLDKPSRREADIEVDFVGFEVPNVFVVGYGIDYAQEFRQLPDVCELHGDE